jgi:hypothetical protein
VLSPILDEALRHKGTRWFRTLHRQIGATWRAQAEDADAVGIELALAVTAVRVLDLEVFRAALGPAYETTRSGHPGGPVVDGMTLVRNAELHMPVVFTPASNPWVGVEDAGGRSNPYVFHDATWQRWDELPAAVRQNRRTSRRCHVGYRDALQGRRVTETLFLALSFFRSLDPTLEPRDSRGELQDFPLPPLKGTTFRYDRLHPDEPSLVDVERRLEQAVSCRNPGVNGARLPL